MKFANPIKDKLNAEFIFWLKYESKINGSNYELFGSLESKFYNPLTAQTSVALSDSIWFLLPVEKRLNAMNVKLIRQLQ